MGGGVEWRLSVEIPFFGSFLFLVFVGVLGRGNDGIMRYMGYSWEGGNVFYRYDECPYSKAMSPT